MRNVRQRNQMSHRDQQLLREAHKGHVERVARWITAKAQPEKGTDHRLPRIKMVIFYIKN